MAVAPLPLAHLAGDASDIHSGPDATLESHRIVFAAERARLTGAVVALG